MTKEEPGLEFHLNNELSTCVLGSSSAGNATLVWSAGTAILVDCGFSPSYITTQLRRLDLDIPDIDGVFITHIHGDHVNEWTVGRFIQARVPIYCPLEIQQHLQKKYYAMKMASQQGLLRTMVKAEVGLNEFLVRSFEVPHDSEGGCFGYSIISDGDGKVRKVSVSTDIARPTKSAVSAMADSDVIVLESNYDEEMLEQSGRPVWLKRRIREDGHLSNDQCGESFLQIFDQSQTLPKILALAHVSQECNTNTLALECTREALGRQGIRGINIAETYPGTPGQTMTI